MPSLCLRLACPWWAMLVMLCITLWPAAAHWPEGQRGPVPESFDCAMRRLAYRYGQQLLPRHGLFESLWYALGLNDECGNHALLVQENSPLVTHDQWTPPADTVYVDAVSGLDGAPGTLAAPVKSLHRALKMVHLGAAIVLRQGNYYLNETIHIGPEHSGLTIAGMPGEVVTISGGKRLEVDWIPSKGPRQGGKVFVANVQGQVQDVPGLQLNGVRATRARYPNLPAGLEVSVGFGGVVAGQDATWTPPDLARYGKSLYFTDQQHIRNVSTENQQYTVGIAGPCAVFDPPVSYWCSENENQRGGGQYTFRFPSGVVPNPGALPNLPYEDASQAVFSVWYPNRWYNWFFETAHYDQSSHNFTFGKGGFHGGEGADTGGDFYVENVWEEFDFPGEFFFNRTTGQLFLNYNGTGSPPKDLEVVATQLDVLLNLTGTQWNPVRNVTLRNLRFMASAPTYLMPHGVPSGGDWALERLGALFFQGTEMTTVTNCTFERLDGNGIMVSGYNRNVTIQDSDFAFVGGTAIACWGFTNETSGDGWPQAGMDGTDENHPRFTSVLRNLVREVGLYEKQNSFFFQAKTVQSRLVGNVFFNGPRAAVNFNDGFGGGDELAQNLIFSTCRESLDHGPINTWDRQPYLTNVTGQPSLIMAERVLHHNFIIDNYSPQEAVDNDDGSYNYHTHHNFIVYGTTGMKSDWGGQRSYHTDNIYAYVDSAIDIEQDPIQDGHEDWFLRNKVVLTLSGDVLGGTCAPPGKTRIAQNQYYTPDGAIIECGMSLEQWQQAGNDRDSTVLHTPSDFMILAWAVDLLSISEVWFIIT